MNEKKDDKPIEMPSRGRPRKKYHNIDSVFNNDFMHKSMYNSSMGFDTSTEEMSLGSMCPYNTRDDSKLLEQFNKIGDVINKRSDQNVVNKIDESKKEHPFNITDDSSQINPRDIQNSHNSFIDSSINSEDNIKNINHKMRTPIFQYPQSPFQYSHPKMPFSQFEDYNKNFFCKQDPSDIEDKRSIYYEHKIPSYYTNFRPVLNTSNFFNPSQNYIRPQSFYRPPDDFDSPWGYKKKRKNNPILWQYVKNFNDNYQSIIHPSKYSSLDYIQGTDIFNRRGMNERECNNSVLPLFLNSNKELNDEYKQIIKNFQKRVKELDFTNVTVHQLKLLMREFGLNHTGKKNELIERAKQTLIKIDVACNAAHKKVNEENKSEEQIDEEYENVFF
ncbi:hypothetical protein NCER_101771 [Vairimorpha ceranae BRL01]|uniref:SAP domain-containing protein n=1 Tax=Vairimorpha ceranae (strain BRL01) TaxID=578460 RepID=C4VAQ5_VAIC1|nr:hypothetical protein NCER_101771 [Vairimorpha ceranae BRL01]